MALGHKPVPYSRENAAMLLMNVDDLGSGDLAPGDTVEGYIGFEIAKGSSLASVTLDAASIGGERTVTWTR